MQFDEVRFLHHVQAFGRGWLPSRAIRGLVSLSSPLLGFLEDELASPKSRETHYVPIRAPTLVSGACKRFGCRSLDACFRACRPVAYRTLEISIVWPMT